MGMDVSRATVYGVSYVELLEAKQEAGADDIEEIFAKAAKKVGLTSWEQIPRPDTITDVYIGVVFYDRPTDSQVEKAKKKVTQALPKLKKLLGEPSSGVEEWSGVTVSY